MPTVNGKKKEGGGVVQSEARHIDSRPEDLERLVLVVLSLRRDGIQLDPPVADLHQIRALNAAPEK